MRWGGQAEVGRIRPGGGGTRCAPCSWCPAPKAHLCGSGGLSLVPLLPCNLQKVRRRHGHSGDPNNCRLSRQNAVNGPGRLPPRKKEGVYKHHLFYVKPRGLGAMTMDSFYG